MPDSQLEKIYNEINESINFLHKNRIIHFDIKLRNIFNNSSFNLYFFSDFGESKVVNSDNLYEEFYDIYNVSGCTTFYMSPEFI